MRWRRGGGRAGDMIDARGARGGGGGLGGLPMGRAGGGVGIVGLLVFLAIQFLGGGGSSGFGIDSPLSGGGGPVQDAPIPASQDPDRDLKDFTSYVFSNAQDVWTEHFDASGRQYDRAKVVLFTGGVDTGCGSASSAVGPFYCPPDRRVYFDLSFYEEMKTKLGGQGGDFAWAYVIAHEVGHHVQQLLGTSDEVRREQQSNPDAANELSVRLELQADCYSGVWAYSVFKAGALQQGDIAEALDAAASVGDDRLQRRAGGGVDPESFTHGTSEQRQRWFSTGRDSGDPGACDTFGADEP